MHPIDYNIRPICVAQAIVPAEVVANGIDTRVVFLLSMKSVIAVAALAFADAAFPPSPSPSATSSATRSQEAPHNSEY